MQYFDKEYTTEESIKMSEVEKMENCVADSQETYFDNAEKDTSLASSQMTSMNESQDFRLVDSEDETSFGKSQQDLESSKQPEKEDPLPSDDKVEAKETTEPQESTAQEKESPTDTEKGEQPKEEPSKTEIEEKVNDGSTNVESKEKNSDEEDEIIQCTPPEIHSPSKIQVLSNSDTTSLKRKAESFDEPPSKISRTVTGDDALSFDKKKGTVDSDDSQQEFSKSGTETNIIIAETQDLMEDEPTQDSLQQSEKNEEFAKDNKNPDPHLARVHENKNETFVETNYEIDKNENVNDSSKFNEVIASKDHSEKVSTVENVAQLNDNTPSQDEVVEKDVTPPSTIAADEKIESELNHNTKNECPTSVKDIAPAHSNEESTTDKENCIESANDTNSNTKHEDVHGVSSSSEAQNDSQPTTKPTNTCKTRMSIEVIYDRTAAIHETKSKPTELVQIDEDGEKIILDSSQEDSSVKSETKSFLDNTKSETVYNSCYDTKSSSDFSYKTVGSTKESSIDSKTDSRLVNGSTESKKCDTDSTASVQSDMFSDLPVLEKGDNNIPSSVHNLNKQMKAIASISKDSDNADLLSVSDNEPDVSIVDDASKSKTDLTHSSSLTKGVQIEKEVGIYVRMKCLLHVDEGTKEFVSKEVMAVHCETVAEPTLSRQKNNDTSASLADISGNDNKDSSPGSVNSNPQMFQLNPSRLSFASTISSLSSASSAASLAAKLAIRDSTHFSLPRGPVKHTKKNVHDIPSLVDRQAIDEAYERLTREWQNSHLLTTTILNFANTELSSVDSHNISNDKLDDQMQKIRSSTPEVQKEVLLMTTPKSTKKGKAVKRPRSKSARADGQSNGLSKISPKVLISAENNSTPSRKKNKTDHVDAASSSHVNISTKTFSQDIVKDELIGKEVFAKWSDNNYYPGTVIDKVKTKYKVNFYDGKNKVLIEDFVVPIPDTLSEGLSVYATTKNDDYGSCGIIVDIEKSNGEVLYLVETDEGERIRVQVKDIFLSSDQAQVLKEEANSDNKSLPSTPKHLGQVTLENMVDGKRRSRRIATPVFTTPKSRSSHTPSAKNTAEPSVSGIASKLKKEKKISTMSEDVSSDSNVSEKGETFLSGVQAEIIGTPNEQIVKGPQNRIKSKSRSKKKAEDEETIATLGPIPQSNSTLFKGMSFILTCASLETIDRYQADSKDSGSDPGTENEEEWVKKPFVRDRLKLQITAGGGKIYNDFSSIPQDEYKNTKLITNVPNTTAKTLLCLSVGIPAYNHKWIIRCCQEGKIVNPAEDELPAGWSLDKQSYVEMFQRPSNKPLTQVVVIIPVIDSEKQFTSFWRQVCENAGAVVLLADNPDSMEGFVEGTIVVTNHRCPSWAIERANELQIPLLSTTWIVQCLIEGKLCLQDSQDRYKYNYIQN